MISSDSRLLVATCRYYLLFFSAVHIRRKEIVVYPDDEAKPPLDQGLNRRAEVTLDGCWPVTKAGEVIRTPQRLNDMRYAEMLEKNCLKMGAVFRDYRIETGSWVFSVRPIALYECYMESLLIKIYQIIWFSSFF